MQGLVLWIRYVRIAETAREDDFGHAAVLAGAAYLKTEIIFWNGY